MQATRRSNVVVRSAERALTLAAAVGCFLAAAIFFGAAIVSDPHADFGGRGAVQVAIVFFLIGGVATWWLARTARRPRSGAAILLASALPLMQTRMWFAPLVLAAVGAYVIAPQRTLDSREAAR